MLVPSLVPKIRRCCLQKKSNARCFFPQQEDSSTWGELHISWALLAMGCWGFARTPFASTDLPSSCHKERKLKQELVIKIFVPHPRNVF